MAKILVVDDEETVREVISRRLRRWGHEVAAVESAAVALERLTAESFAIVFCDVLMPGQDGVWLLRQISERWPGTAVVMVSGAQSPEIVQQARRLGAVAYVPKPVGREVLRQALEQALDALESSGRQNPR